MNVIQNNPEAVQWLEDHYAPKSDYDYGGDIDDDCRPPFLKLFTWVDYIDHLGQKQLSQREIARLHVVPEPELGEWLSRNWAEWQKLYD